MRRILKKGYAVSYYVKIKSDFYFENRYAAFELVCAVSVYQKSVIFIKIKCAVLAEAYASYFRYVTRVPTLNYT